MENSLREPFIGGIFNTIADISPVGMAANAIGGSGTTDRLVSGVGNIGGGLLGGLLGPIGGQTQSQIPPPPPPPPPSLFGPQTIFMIIGMFMFIIVIVLMMKNNNNPSSYYQSIRRGY
jgi:MFS family permease